MRFLNKENFQKALNALVVTIAFSAICHLLLVSAVAIIRKDISYVNPLDFLGISILLPQYRESAMVAAIGWLALIILFFVILFVRVHYNVYVSFIRESPLAALVTETTKRLREKIKY